MGCASSPTRSPTTRSSSEASAQTSSCRAATRFVAALRDAVPDGVDAVFDTALLTRRMFPAIREGGAIAVVRGWEGDDVEDGIRIERVLVGTVLERTDWLREVRDLAVRGVLVPRVADTYPAEQAADAQRRMEAGGLRGRAVIVFRERRRT